MHLGRAEEARARLAHWLAVDPTSDLLRHEAVALGEPIRAVLAPSGRRPGTRARPRRGIHGAGPLRRCPRAARAALPDGGRGRGRAGERGAAGSSARCVLPRLLPRDGGRLAERGLRRRLRPVHTLRVPEPGGQPPGPASARSRSHPTDATARFLLGSLLLSGGQADAAIAEWQEARRLNPKIPVLHRNLGLALLQASHDPAAALEVLREGMGVDGTNMALYVRGRPGGQRAGRARGRSRAPARTLSPTRQPCPRRSSRSSPSP